MYSLIEPEMSQSATIGGARVDGRAKLEIDRRRRGCSERRKLRRGVDAKAPRRRRETARAPPVFRHRERA